MQKHFCICRRAYVWIHAHIPMHETSLCCIIRDRFKNLMITISRDILFWDVCNIGYPFETNLNSVLAGKFDYSLKLVNFKLISMINILSIFCEIAIKSMPRYLTDHGSALVQVMTWCCQATSHYLSQCWPRSMSPHCVSRPHWVKNQSWSNLGCT